MSLVRLRDAAVSSGGDEHGPIPCARCGRPTARATLVQYGARCFSCYEDYIKERLPEARIPKERSPLGWAHHLKALRFQGDSMTKAQIDMYQSVLERRMTGKEAA